MHSARDVRQWLTTTGIVRGGIVLFRSVTVVREVPCYSSALLLVTPLQLLNWSLASLLIGIGIYYGQMFTQNLSTLRGEHASLAILLVYIVFTAGGLIMFAFPSVLYALSNTKGAKESLQRKIQYHRRIHSEPHLPVIVGDGLSGSRGTATSDPNAGTYTVTPQENIELDPIIAANAADQRVVAHASKESITAHKASMRAQEALLQHYQHNSRTSIWGPQERGAVHS